jgi:hypothetical protein
MAALVRCNGRFGGLAKGPLAGATIKLGLREVQRLGVCRRSQW